MNFFFRVSSFLFLFGSSLFSQTKVGGVVYDNFSNPLPFATVVFKDTSNGVITGYDGKFYIESDEKYNVILVSFVGFQTKEVLLKKPEIYGLKINLIEGELLNEIVLEGKPKKRLKKKENPAYKVLKKVWANKKKNGVKRSKSYEYKKYTSTEIGLNSIDSTFLRNALGKGFDSVIKIIKPRRQSVNFNVPINLNEKVENVYGYNSIFKQRIDIEAEKITGIIAQGFAFERMANVFRDIDVYKDDIEILKRVFVSPISRTGFGSYDYVLRDSTKIGKKTFYKILYYPRREGDLVFQGSFTVVAPTYALSKIDMRVNKKVNLNFVRNLYLDKSFLIKNDSIYLPEENIYEADFSILTKSDKEKGFYVKRTEIFDNYILDKPRKVNFYLEKNVKIATDQFERDEKYWTRSKTDDGNKLVREVLVELKDNRKINSVANTIRILTTGYIPINSWLEYGRYWDSFAYNDVENLRMKIGFRTFKNLNDRFRTQFYLAHGFGDKKIKFALDTRYLLLQNPRLLIGGICSKDFEQLGSKLLTSSILLENQPFGNNLLISRGKNFYLSDVEKYGVSIDLGINNNLHIGINALRKHISSAIPDVFDITYLKDNELKNTISDFTIATYLKYTPSQNVYGYGAMQRRGRNRYPELLLSYKKGLKNIFESDFEYDNIQILYKHPILLSKAGTFDTTLGVGKKFGTLPLVLLSTIPSNQGFSYTPRTFALLNYYDLVTDEYVTGHFEHHFNGFILNRFPLIKKLKIRSLLTFRGAYGNISDENIKINRSTINYNAPSKSIYYEYGFGFENIGVGNLKIFRIDFIWRSDLPNNFMSNDASTPSPTFGFQLGVRPNF